jgi:hypothetical protein
MGAQIPILGTASPILGTASPIGDLSALRPEVVEVRWFATLVVSIGLFTMQATRSPHKKAKRRKRRYSFFEEVMKGVEVEESWDSCKRVFL